MLKNRLLLGVFLTVLLPILGGCGAEKNVKMNKEYSYLVEVRKSPIHTLEFIVQDKEQTIGLTEFQAKLALQNEELDFIPNELNGIPSLLGVINTANKQWHLYVNGTTLDLLQDHAIHYSDTIEWRYE